MLRKFLASALTTMVLGAISGQASAALVFDDLIKIQTSVLGIGAADVSDISIIDFIGQVAINGADTDGTPGFSVGDRSRVVGGALNDGITVGGTPIAGGLSTASGGTFELTTVVKNWDATVSSIVTDFPVPGALSLTITYDTSSAVGHTPTGLGPVAGSGIVDLYIDTTPDYDDNDVNTSADAGGSDAGSMWVASFGIFAQPSFTSATAFTLPPALPGGATGLTNVRLLLLDQIGGGTATTADDFFVTNDGLAVLNSDLALASLISSTDTPINDPPMLGIDRLPAGADAGPVNIGAFSPASAFGGGTDAFVPPTSVSPGAFPFDVVSTFDSNNRFAVVPEPSSIVLFMAGLAGLGIHAARRRRQEDSVG